MCGCNRAYNAAIGHLGTEDVSRLEFVLAADAFAIYTCDAVTSAQYIQWMHAFYDAFEVVDSIVFIFQQGNAAFAELQGESSKFFFVIPDLLQRILR